MLLANYTNCLGYEVFSDTLDNLPRKGKLLISTVNQYSFCIAEKDQDFKEALQQSDVLLPDGIAIVWASKLLYSKKIQKIAGADIHDFFLEKLNRESGSCFYLGASETTLGKIKARINTQFPNIKFGSYSPPFKPVFSSEDTNQMIQKVNQFEPDVLFVGMTAPKQEKWSFVHKENLNSKVICSIGAVFDFYAGTVERPSKVWIDLGLEWFGRLIKEPKRMWKRYIYYGIIFSFYLISAKFQLVFRKKTKAVPN